VILFENKPEHNVKFANGKIIKKYFYPIQTVRENIEYFLRKMNDPWRKFTIKKIKEA